MNKDMSLPLHTQCMKALHSQFLGGKEGMREEFGEVEEEKEEEKEEEEKGKGEGEEKKEGEAEK